VVGDLQRPRGTFTEHVKRALPSSGKACWREGSGGSTFARAHCGDFLISLSSAVSGIQIATAFSPKRLVNPSDEPEAPAQAARPGSR
jgi:hypothetical protein